MLRNKDILELKRRFKKEACTITKMCGCYVDANKNKVVELNETFLNLEDEEFYKYLDIAKKALSGTIGNNLLELHFTKEEEEQGGKQQYLLGLRESGLRNPELLEHLYDMIIENYDYVGNYLILIFHDAYDVITKTKNPGCESHYTSRGFHDFRRFEALANRAQYAINKGVFLPNETSFACGECPYRDRCRQWHLKRWR